MAHTIDKSNFKTAQIAVNNCKIHNRTTDQYCEDCGVLLCLVCARLSHVQHKCEAVRKLADDKKKVLKTTSLDVKERYIPLLHRRIEIIDNIKKENTNRCREQMAILLRHHDVILKNLAKIKEGHKERLMENLSTKNAALDLMKSELEQQTESLTETCSVLDEGNMTDYSFLQSFSSLENTLKTIPRSRKDISSSFYSMLVSPQKINSLMLESLAGTLLDTNEITLSEVASFVFGADAINSLAASSESACWLYEDRGTQIVQIGFQGEVLNTVDLKRECDAFTRGPHNEIIVSHLEEQSISVIASTSSNFHEENISTKPLAPEGVTLANNGGILVTLVDDSTKFTLDATSRRLVRLMTLSGEVTRDYEYREDGKSRLFTLPRRAIQKRNGDICVIDFLSETQGIIHVISIEGQKLSAYTGQNLEQNFLPTDILADDQCNIIITDPTNNVLHLLNSEGEFLKLLTPSKSSFSIPISLTLFGEIIWVGNLDGRVNIYRYRNDIVL